nr:pyocin R2, holin [Stutzerimonas stutzeri]
MSTEQQVQQSLADLPTWLLILVALAGLTGEMWRADAAGMAVGELIKRV